MILNFIRALLNFIVETFETTALAIIFFLVLYLFLVRPHQIHGDSMLPNYHDRDYLLTEVVSFKFLGRELERGDAIVFHAPEQPSLDFIKRIIALPGEKIKIQNGRIFIVNRDHPGGFLLQEPYLATGVTTQPGKLIREGELFEVGQGYVVMGDNRPRSSDSRDWGVVKKEAIVGHAWLRYWPPPTLAVISTPKYPD